MITVDVPREWLLNANQRLHWRQKAERSRCIRYRAELNTRETFVYMQSFVRKVRCTVHVAWPDRRRRDVHNLMPTIKACIDGLVDAGLLEDDSDRHLIGPDLRVSDSLCGKDLACSLTFTFEDY